MKRSTDRILTTHPGRLPDPSVRDAVMQARESGDRATFETLTKQGIGEMVSLQREAGVDIMSDGEFWKARDQLYYGSRATGIASKPLAAGEWPSLLGTHEERVGTQFAEFFAIYDKLGNTPRPGVTVAPFVEKSVMVGEVKAISPSPIIADIAMVKDALAAAGQSTEGYSTRCSGRAGSTTSCSTTTTRPRRSTSSPWRRSSRRTSRRLSRLGLTLQIDDPGLLDRWSMVHAAGERRRVHPARDDSHRSHELGARGHPGGVGALSHLLGQLAHAAHERPAPRGGHRPHAQREGGGVLDRGRGRGSTSWTTKCGRRTSSRTASCSSPA